MSNLTEVFMFFVNFIEIDHDPLLSNPYLLTIHYFSQLCECGKFLSCCEPPFYLTDATYFLEM